MNDEYLFLFAQWGVFTTEQCRLIIKKFGLLRLLQTVPKQDYGLLVLLVLESIYIGVCDVLRTWHILPPKRKVVSGFSITDY